LGSHRTHCQKARKLPRARRSVVHTVAAKVSLLRGDLASANADIELALNAEVGAPRTNAGRSDHSRPSRGPQIDRGVGRSAAIGLAQQVAELGFEEEAENARQSIDDVS
jgi:hypothetical protein